MNAAMPKGYTLYPAVVAIQRQMESIKYTYLQKSHLRASSNVHHFFSWCLSFNYISLGDDKENVFQIKKKKPCCALDMADEDMGGVDCWAI